MKNSKMENIFTSIVREDTSFIDIKKVLLNYSWASALQNDVNFVDTNISDSIENMMLIGYLPTSVALHVSSLCSLQGS